MNDQAGPTSVEEQRLAEWLEATTPQPPRVLTAEDIAARVPPGRPSGRWMPVLAAVTVALVVIVGIAIAATQSGNRSVRPASPTSSAHPSPSPSTTASPRPLPVHPWQARELGSLRLIADSTTVLDGQLYGAVDRGDSARLYRLNPSTGQPLAHADQVYGGLHPVAAAGLLWIPAAGTKALLGLDPMTLAVKTTVTVPARTGIATQGAGTVVVSDDHQVSFIRDGKIAHRLTVGPRISSIAMSADGTRLYVATQPGRSPGPGQIGTLDPRTGAALAAPLDSGLAVIYGLRATAGGLWSTSLGGMHAVTGFQPYHARHPVSTYGVGMSGGGALTLPSISNGVAWLGSTDELGCADPDTGTVRARVPIGTKHGLTIAAISGLAFLDGKVYAVYNGINGGPANALIVMTPPAKCFGS